MGFLDKGQEPALIIPALRPLYERTAILYYPLLRIVAGGFLLVHGWPKFNAGAAALVPFLTRIGFEPPIFWAWVLVLMETVGALCIIFGLFVRPIALAAVIETYHDLGRPLPESIVQRVEDGPVQLETLVPGP